MYYAFIDGNYDNGYVITCDKGEKTYDVASGLADKTHDLLIYKRTDGGEATTAFLGLELDDGAKLEAPDRRPTLRMEVYGDSISTGLGCDRARGKEHSREATDNFFSYGSITARNIGAEFRCISKSGIGLIKSWWPTIMPQYYDRACATSLEGSGKAWDFSKWTADLVVINIFQNDSWTRKNTTSEEGVSAYVDFVKKLRGHYPEARIVCTLGSMDASKGKWAGFVKKAVQQLNDAGDRKVYSYIFKVQTGHTHPNSKVHAKMAQEITKFLTTLDMDITLANPLPEEVTVTFKPGSEEESGRAFWVFDRGPDGSPAYLEDLIPDENWKDMEYDQVLRAWTVKIDLDHKASHIDVFSNHRKTLLINGREYATAISSPYTRVKLSMRASQ